MELTMVKDGYDAYLKEIKKRDELVKAIVNNDDYTNIQLEYADLYEKTNEELGKIIDKIAIEDFLMLISNINEDKKKINIKLKTIIIIGIIFAAIAGGIIVYATMIHNQSSSSGGWDYTQ